MIIYKASVRVPLTERPDTWRRHDLGYFHHRNGAKGVIYEKLLELRLFSLQEEQWERVDSGWALELNIARGLIEEINVDETS